MAKKIPARRKYGRRADGQTQTSISLSEETLQMARKEAEKQGTTLSKLIEEILKKGMQLLFWLVLIAKLTQSPTDWSGEALAQAAGTGCVWFGQGVAWLVSGAWQVGGALLASL